MFVGERDPKHRSGEDRHDRALYFDRFFRIYHVDFANSGPEIPSGPAAQLDLSAIAGKRTVSTATVRAIFTGARFAYP